MTSTTDTTAALSSSAERATRLLLVCHGEGLYNRYTNLSRRLIADEGGLSAVGWEQANGLAVWLRDHEQVDLLASGSQLRSRLTGQRISQVLHLPLTVIANLPPTGPGESSQPHATLLPSPLASPENTVQPPPIGVDQTNAAIDLFFGQVQAMLAELMAGQWGKTVVLVTHRQAIAALISSFFVTPNTLDIQIDETSISELRWQEDRWRLVGLNRREHLPCPVMVQPVVNQPRRSHESEEYANLQTVRAVYNRVAAIYAASKKEEDLPRIHHLVRFAALPKDLDILDVGTGPGTLALALADAGARLVLGVDISEAMLEQAEYLRLTTASPSHERVGFRLAPAHNLPFADDRFDAVFCRLILQYLKHPQESIREMVRVLKPGGHLILAELLSVDDPVKRATQNAIEERRDPGHVAARSADQYRKLVAEAGLVVDRSEIVTFERELDEWLCSLDTRPEDRAAVGDMLEAGLETDAAGINARHRGNTLIFDQRMIYLKAVKT